MSDPSALVAISNMRERLVASARVSMCQTFWSTSPAASVPLGSPTNVAWSAALPQRMHVRRKSPGAIDMTIPQVHSMTMTDTPYKSLTSTKK
jgi:hypothetical protein